MVLFQNFGADNIRRHQIGRKLYPPERKMQRLRHGFYDQRFSQSGHTLQQTMSSCQKGHQQFVQYMVLPDNYLLYLAFQPGQFGKQGFYIFFSQFQ